MTDLDLAMTTLMAARANTPADVTSQIADRNNNLESSRRSASDNWLLSWTACRIADKKSNAPKPPGGFRGGVHQLSNYRTRKPAGTGQHPQRPRGRNDAGRLPVALAVKPTETDRRTCAVASSFMETAWDAKVPGEPGKG